MTDKTNEAPGGRRLFATVVGFLPRLWSNWISLIGALLASCAGVTILVTLVIDLTSPVGFNAYASAVLYLCIPALLALGLLLIPLGLLRERRRTARAGGAPAEADSALAAFARVLDNKKIRRRVGFVLLMTVVNVLIFSTVTYRAVSYMDTPKFCGATCHTVMQPEYDAYAHSPHSRVGCVQCHVGSGAPSALSAKLSGVRQLWGVATGSYHRPIETPVHSLRPASETCEHCHQANRQSGSRLAFRVHFKEDEANTPQVTAMMLHLGGHDARTNTWSGIHSHATTQYQIRYEMLDDKRQAVGKIQKVEGGKIVKEWLPPKPPGDGAAAAAPVVAMRTMDCVDCHNRAAHAYDGTPEAAVTKALADGRLDREVPWLYQVGLGVLKTETPPREQAEAAFRKALAERYGKDHVQQQPPAEKLDQAAAVLATLYRRNVYPQMNLGWNNYPSLIGHGGPDPGKAKSECFRCHSGEHRTAEGQELSSKCALCHEVMIKDEPPADLPDELRPLLRL
jgi:nitrate/TMAO reductase-like tetraheme cytochrome c subunit